MLSHQHIVTMPCPVFLSHVAHAALRHVVACALSSKSAVNLDVFGFNWSSKSDVTHMVGR